MPKSRQSSSNPVLIRALKTYLAIADGAEELCPPGTNGKGFSTVQGS
jgi:hypothetical protein